jgi:hypothetical protein
LKLASYLLVNNFIEEVMMTDQIDPNLNPDTNEDTQKAGSNSGPEVDPAKVGNNTEVDLDKSKNKTYPDPKTRPPERH